MAADIASSSEMTDGPVVSVINKRIRALRKKQNRILQMEESLAQGKTLNKEQEETLRSKSAVLSGIDELEKLRQPLLAAISQEISLALEKHQNPETPIGENPCEETGNTGEEKQAEAEGVPEISDLLNLLYFGCMFDVKTLMLAHENMLTRTHERNCCLTYDYVTDDDAADPLKEWDFDLISMLASSLVSRPVDSISSHKDALQKCVQHAKNWLANSDQPIELNSNVTYASLREKLNKILASDYFTTTPKMKAPVEMAAAAGSYSSFQVPVHGSVVELNVPVQVESSAAEYPQEEEELSNSHGDEIYGDEDHQESDLQAQTEAAILDTDFEQKSRDLESKEQQYPPRRSQQNYRGGRGGGDRRGYPNGRGGRGSGRGGYQNGLSQFYDQPSNYYSRNYNYRGRGGRSGNYNYHAPTSYAGHVQAES
ncbi:glycine-rich protein [Forsythia ovata]|uniref:Glycine-rich protein n=1 Tax=Forsythia ovata TaxID=205694 RepID=A0ABD1WBE9_9LAMI